MSRKWKSNVNFIPMMRPSHNYYWCHCCCCFALMIMDSRLFDKSCWQQIGQPRLENLCNATRDFQEASAEWFLIIDQYIKYVTYLFIVTLSVYWWRLEFGRDKEEVALVDYWWREGETVEDQLLLFHFIWDWGWLLMIVADVIPTDETKQAVVHMMEWMMSIINISCGSVIATNPQ